MLNDAPTGWRSESAQQAARIEQFEHDPDDEYWGFASGNDYLTQRFRDGERPIAAPDDDTIVVNACEATLYGIATNVQRQDQFWVKSQPYSV